MKWKVLTMTVLMMTLASAPLMAQDAARVAESTRSPLEGILGFLLYVVAPILGVVGFVKGAGTIITYHEVQKGLSAVGASIILGFLPTFLKSFFGIDASSLAQVFR